MREAVLKAIDNYEKYIAQKGVEIPVLEAYSQVVRDVYRADKDIEYGKEISKKLKNHINSLIYKKTKGYFLDLEAFGQEHGVQFPEVDMMYGVLKEEAPYLFHSYLLYLESKRKECDRFYSPKLYQLNHHGLIQSMQDLEDGVIKRLCISAPPGTQKTTLEKFFASWIIGKYVSDYSLFFSHNADMTDMFYRGVLDITTNKEEYNFASIFPECVFESKNAETHSVNFGKYKPFASLQCSSIGAGNAGKVRASKYLYCDDLIAKIEDALNDRMLEKIWRIYSVDLKQRKLNQDVKELIIMTRWSNRDVIGRIIDIYGDSEDTRVINVPDIDPETGKSNFDYKYNGMTVAFFEDQALTMDEITYNALYKGITVERKGLLFQDDELRRYRELPNREPDAIYGICDTKEKGTDYMVLPVMYQYDTDYYMVDCVCSDNTDYGAQYSNLTNILIDYNVQQCRFEANQGGQRIAYEVRTRLENARSRCNITEKHTESNKEARILANADWVKKHILFKDADLYAPRSDYSTFMGWLKRYTSKGKNEHDDVPDCLSLFCLWVTDGANRSRKARIIKSPV